jgi:hypothetical protein
MERIEGDERRKGLKERKDGRGCRRGNMKRIEGEE